MSDPASGVERPRLNEMGIRDSSCDVGGVSGVAVRSGSLDGFMQVRAVGRGRPQRVITRFGGWPTVGLMAGVVGK